jgi:hypothetical protein
MCRKEAEEFEERLQQLARGETVEEKWAPLIETAQQATMLADPPPPPPHQLQPGRQRLLAEAARLRLGKATPRKQWLQIQGTMRLAAALVAVVLVFGIVFGVGQAAADSLPGEPLYGLKLAAEEVRLALTTDSEAKTELSLTLTAKRLAEIADLLARGEPVDESVPQRLEQQLMAALQAALQIGEPAKTQALHRLETMIQQQQQVMTSVMAGLGPQQQVPVRQLLRVMERVHEQVQARQGEPGGTRPGPSVQPSPSSAPASQATPRRGEPRPTEPPGEGVSPKPTREPGGPMPTATPDSQPGPQPSDQPGGPMPTDSQGGGGSSPQPSATPGGPMPTDSQGGGPGSQPTETPGGPMPTDPPGGGHGSKPTGTAVGPTSTNSPGSPGPQSTAEPNQPTPTAKPGSGSSGGGTTKP